MRGSGKDKSGRTIEYILNTGSLFNVNDLSKAIESIDARIKRRKRDLNKPKALTSLILDEINRLNIYRDEFESLRKSL